MKENNVYNPDACYELKVYKLFYLFEKTRLTILCAATVLCALHMALNIAQKGKEGVPSALIVFGVYLLALFVWVFSYPSRIRIMPESIAVKHYPLLVRILVTHPILSSEKADNECNIRVYNIEKAEFSQTPIERLFNVGRVRFFGVVSKSRGSESSAKKGEYTVYGIVNFEYSREFIQKHLRIKS